ncbi:hypothetical protein BJ878DRAFT_555061 [Calycina marina]|uniref:Uncharacterized protein n=1 Tax=Calycina marina TaxID=1763456 RepID=A0A9P8CD20_9HELO|nr:hypothetical protein BJ878DRAFT_555061 [Calycina marina]
MAASLQGAEGIVPAFRPLSTSLQVDLTGTKLRFLNEQHQAKPCFCDGGAEEIAAAAESGEPILNLTKDIITENAHVKEHTITSMQQAIEQRDEYRTEHFKLWNWTVTAMSHNGEPEGMMNVILCPVGPGVASTLGTAKWWGHTSPWNLLHYPALIFSLEQVDVENGGQTEEYTSMNEKEKFNWDLWEEFDAEGSKDAPIRMQLVDRR